MGFGWILFETLSGGAAVCWWTLTDALASVGAVNQTATITNEHSCVRRRLIQTRLEKDQESVA